LDDPIASLQKGWSMFSSFAMQGAKLAVSGAETIGKTVTETVIKPTTTAIRDPNFNNNMSSYVSQFQQKVTEVGTKGFQVATEVGTKGFAIATEAATKGIDLASNVTKSTFSQVSQYTPVSPNGTGWDKVDSPDLKWDEWGTATVPSNAKSDGTSTSVSQVTDNTPTNKEGMDASDLKWDEWGSPSSAEIPNFKDSLQISNDPKADVVSKDVKSEKDGWEDW
jgi:hypothetical protein